MSQEDWLNENLELVQAERDALKGELQKVRQWADQLRDRIRDISLGEDKEDIEMAENECRIRHEGIVRPSHSSWPVSNV